MKIFILSLLFSFLSLIVISCSIAEEITFHPDGRIKYSYTIDGSNFMQMAPTSSSSAFKGMTKDSTISFSDLLEMQKDSISKLPLKEQKKIAALKPLSITMHQDEDKQEFFIRLHGMFTNSKTLNEALEGLQTLNSAKNTPGENTEFMAKSTYDWNTSRLVKTSYVSNAMKTDSLAQNLTQMFTGGKYQVLYKFPKKIKHVNHPEAIISADRKSVSIEYDAQEYLISPEKTNLIIELEQ
ncbi:hypothetical protein [Apibacter sp. HY039]|uniref:hypothetical protein n=1 Tax=Apibacter sp. HY039 TaxID=2501476 RepID=UPI000FEB657E|nr:hypothetical protein [Apibacter sp. HY039]